MRSRELSAKVLFSVFSPHGLLGLFLGTFLHLVDLEQHPLIGIDAFSLLATQRLEHLQDLQFLLFNLFSKIGDRAAEHIDRCAELKNFLV
jgi:hypothetical protein